jgi:hypothetical protein
MNTKLTKVAAGWFANADGTVAVVADGVQPPGQARANGAGLDAGVVGREWALAQDPQGRLRDDPQAGQNLGWFDTKRDAVASAASRGLLVAS